jgi:heme-degrading monooxygenase HmoA
MIVEYIRYTIDASHRDAFEHAYSEAGHILEAAPQCVSHEVSRCSEEPTAFTVRIEWESLRAHEEGFRHSPAFGPFLDLVKPYFGAIQEMRHYEPLATAARV